MFKRKNGLLIVLIAILMVSCNLPSSATQVIEPTQGALDTPAAPLATEVPVDSPTDIPALAGNSSISGLVFHDECAGSGQAPGGPIPPGCLDFQGKLIANGIKDPDEIGIAGVWVNLGAGSCPATGLYKIQTNNLGVFSFPDIPAGQYCVVIDPAADEMMNPVSILIPGNWTHPQLYPEAVLYEVDLAENMDIAGVFFGWDYQNLPIIEITPTPEETECEDAASLEDDLTYPPNSTVNAGENFIKTWRIKNEGTCTWDAEYSFEFIQGDQMGGASPSPLPHTVAPGATMDVSVQLTAPGAQGTYQADWLIKDGSGGFVGFGENADKPFRILIIVKPTNLSSLKDFLGNPDYQDDFETDTNWSTFSDDPNVVFEHDSGQLVMRSLTDVGWDVWTWSWPVQKNFYLETEVTTSADCSGLDRYGLIARVKDFDNVYLFGFSCDGRYSIKLWQDGYTVLKDWTSSPHINAGPSQTNFLGIKMVGNQMTIYANGEELATVTNNALSEGKFGIFMAAPKTIGFEAIFEMIRYWSLPD